jgi:putative hemolysin
MLALVALLGLAACDAPPRAPVAGPEARKLVDTATLAYADCIVKGAEAAPLGQSPGLVVAQVVRDCAPRREALARAIESFHALGNPSFTPERTALVAEASIQQLEPQIRNDAIAAYVSRALPAEKAE